jgi:hypothetical protein
MVIAIDELDEGPWRWTQVSDKPRDFVARSQV